jgi:hypothetical protein
VPARLDFYLSSLDIVARPSRISLSSASVGSPEPLLVCSWYKILG